jgi:NitT/TauT family transport system permease protein
MVAIIVLLDQLLWQPLVAWGHKFRMEERSEEAPPRSWFLDLLKRSKLVGNLREWSRRAAEDLERGVRAPQAAGDATPGPGGLWKVLSGLAFLGLVLGLCLGVWKVVALFSGVTLPQWLLLFGKAFATLARVLCAVALGLLWTVPVGLWIGLSPRLSRLLQPVIQIIASFPAPMIFPAAILLMAKAGIPLSAGSVFLMLLGVQWYILFNVVAGATALPSDLKETARVYRFGVWQRFKQFYLPGILPYLITGMVAAAGGAWNASIVAEFTTFQGRVDTAWGLGSQISLSASRADFPLLAAGVVVMALVVVTFNRLVWDRLCRLAEEKYSLGK